MAGSKDLFTQMREQGMDIDMSGNIYVEPKPMSNIDKALMYYEQMHQSWYELKLLIKQQ